MAGCRSYRLPKTFDAAVDEIIINSGTQFDPDIVHALSADMDKIQTLFSVIGGKTMSANFQIESRNLIVIF